MKSDEWKRNCGLAMKLKMSGISILIGNSSNRMSVFYQFLVDCTIILISIR